MKCPVCGSEYVEFMRGFAVQNAHKDNELVTRAWFCDKCDSGGDIEYMVKEVKILRKNGKKTR